MTDEENRGECEHCRVSFHYSLVHNGFNESSFAYCELCGMTAILSGWYAEIPAEANFVVHGPVSRESEALLAPCVCGGQFRGDAAPRCPTCRQILDPLEARVWIEANAPGAQKGWRWQNSWQGLYAIVIERRMASDVWRSIGTT
jgi:hypothetical protein